MSAKKLALLASVISFFANFRVSLAALTPVQEKAEGPIHYATLDQLTVVFANVASVVSTLAGFALLIMLIRGGVGYITAQGDPKAVASARATLTWAVVGFLVVLASYLIISLLVGFFNVPGIGKFCVPGNGTACPL